VINGVWGDHLAASGNPLAIRMALRVRGRDVELTAEALAAAMPQPRRRIALLIHGLCMNDRAWQRNGHDHGALLAQELGYATLALNYNSGLHISENGEQLAVLLEQLVACWPVPVDELVLLGHSMGGLVARAACHAAGERSLAWLQRLRRLVFLGTPHHGAALERGGRLVDAMLELSPYAAPFARLGRARSAGITDLRFGNVRRADWQGRHAHDQRHDDRVPTPLPAGVQAYCVAATTAVAPRGLAPCAARRRPGVGRKRLWRTPRPAPRPGRSGLAQDPGRAGQSPGPAEPPAGRARPAALAGLRASAAGAGPPLRSTSGLPADCQRFRRARAACAASPGNPRTPRLGAAARRSRATVPVAARFDLQANAPPVDDLGFSSAYRTCPHVNMRQTAECAMAFIAQRVQGLPGPTASACRLDLLLPKLRHVHRRRPWWRRGRSRIRHGKAPCAGVGPRGHPRRVN
jgi:hypothetical protein